MFFSKLKKKSKTFFKLPSVITTLRWSWKILLLIFVMDTGYLIGIWPNWKIYAEGPIQQSSFIHNYISEHYRHRDWPPLRWKPTSFKNIPKHMIRALIVAEDARFYSHSGIDTDALQEVMEYNLSKKRFIYGGSTISQQTIKNIFLSPSRNPFRKWHEFVLTIGMERNLSKKRILSLYLNIAEFGRGIYGVNAAANYYWGIPASRLSVKQAVELAATLPAPVKHNPNTRTKFFLKRVKKIGRLF
ncbi:MAG: monofunctional biosynthetic peptidoglycan transglycosylase [Gammaproteobacteria bacterium]|nr:MAG: monofunctional biosynthetic peptidoglycan transglycosylase [Gammaproteobacteria bacterium]